MDYWESQLNNAFDIIGYKPARQWHVRIIPLHANEKAYMDYTLAEIGLSQSYQCRLETHEDILVHEVVHVHQAEEDPEKYMKIRQMPGSGGFRRVFHDTLLNPYEVEARLAEKQRILTQLPTHALTTSDIVHPSPIEWLISNPVQAGKMLQLHSEWGHLLVNIVLTEYEERFLDPNVLAKTALVPEAIVLSSYLEELLLRLREITPDIGKFLGWT